MFRAKKILLVCTGNSCRSVMAAGFLKEMLKDKGDFDIITAGTAAIRGLPPTVEAVQVMSEQAIDITDHRSSPLSPELINEVDLILVMERRHKEHIARRLPDAQDKIYLLSEFGRPQEENSLVDPDIPDPIGKDLDFYRKIASIIKESILRTVKQLL